MTPEAPAKTTLQDYLVPVWRHKWAVAVLVFLITAATYLYYEHQPAQYSAGTDIYLSTSGAGAIVTGTDQAGTDQDLATQARILQSRAVADQVARKLKFRGDPQTLLDSVTAVAQASTNFITIQAVWPTPHGAADLANAFASEFLRQRRMSSRDDAASALAAAREAFARSPKGGDERLSLADRIAQLEILLSSPVGTARQIDRALPPAFPVSPRPKRNAIFAFALGLALAIIAAYAFDRIDRRIRGVDDVKPNYDAPVLAAIPRVGGQEALSPPASIAPKLVEPFRTLRTALDTASANASRPPRVILVTSAVAREGKSTIVRNLALAYHEAGKRVAVIDADLRRPSLARALFTPASPGLSEVLRGAASLDQTLFEIATTRVFLVGQPAINGSPTQRSSSVRPRDLDDLSIRHDASTQAELVLLPSGARAADPPALLATREFKALIRELKENFDLVLIDSPPLLTVSDAIPILREADGTLLVSRVGTTTGESAKRVADLLSRVGTHRLLGVVANDVGQGALLSAYHEYDSTTVA
jgi:succinoglycan biosynthesis transport protein ExoP